MTRVFLLVFIFLSISIVTTGQCVNSPTVTLSSTSGTACGLAPFTVSGNTFGGSATSVTITENGSGTVNPGSSKKSPFSFTYTPKSGDYGKKITITVTTNNPLGLPCEAATDFYILTVNHSQSAPLVGTIIQPTCAVLTGSVGLSGLPSSGSWTITRNPGGITTSGSGVSATVSGIAAGTYTFTVTNSLGCTSDPSAGVVINAQPVPAAPIIGTITQPLCSVSMGSVGLTGLPAAGTWTLTRSPDGVKITGSGTSIVIPNLPEGTYTYTVTNSAGCVSMASASIVITAQPSIPAAPVIGAITAPTCALATGNVVMSGLPSAGTWTLTRYPGTVKTNGTGTSITLTGLAAGTYNFTLTNSSGCTSVMSSNVIIPPQPIIPAPPLIGTITQPGDGIQTGSVVLNGLPETGSWTLTLSPGNTTTQGNGITKTISGLAAGTYSFTVTNSAGCTSGVSAGFSINTLNGKPTVNINAPDPVCSPGTVDLTDPKITAGSALNLVYSYWINAGGTIPYATPAHATAGIYYIKGTASDGSYAVKPVTVTVYQVPVANAGQDQVLAYLSGTTMGAQLVHNYETGIWSLVSGSGKFADATLPRTAVNGLSAGKNLFLWTVTNGVCPASSDTVAIIVHDRIIPTLITPNMDGINDYLILRGSDTQGNMELVIFDRRGVEVYKNGNYDDSWNGVDLNGNPLSDDTYFYVLKWEDGKPLTGYIVIRR